VTSSASPPPQPRLALVSPDLQGVNVVSVVTVMSCLLGVLQVPPFLPAVGVATAMMAGSSSSGVGDAESPPPRRQESPPLVLLAVVLSVWHCPSVHPAPIFLVAALTLKGGAVVTGVVPHQLRSSVDPPRAW
jgi:hypothetical protein